MGNKRREGFAPGHYLLFSAAVLLLLLLCVCIGSVSISPADTFAAIWSGVTGQSSSGGISPPIILSVRLPRVLCVALVGSALSLCGGAVQGLLRNPLADSSTLGVSSGASLGAVLAIALGFQVPGFSGGGSMLGAMVFALLTLVAILSLAYRLDYSLSTNTIILIGMIFTMFCTSMISLVMTFSGEKLRTITFWTMGSLSGSTYANVLTMLIALVICGAAILRYTRELNAFAMGEDNARHVGIDVKRVKLVVLISVSALVGVCVSIGGTIGFVGLVIPHLTRMITGPNHKRLLPACLFVGAGFLLLADLVSRVLLNPLELPIGVITSIIGSISFIYLFYLTRKVR